MNVFPLIRIGLVLAMAPGAIAVSGLTTFGMPPDYPVHYDLTFVLRAGGVRVPFDSV